DDVINTGGEKVVAGEVAAVLSRHPAVRDVVVVGRPDPEWGERVTAVVVPSPDAPAPPELTELRAFVRETMPAHAAPRELELVEAIPRLPTGKPDRARLASPVACGQPAARTFYGVRLDWSAQSRVNTVREGIMVLP